MQRILKLFSEILHFSVEFIQQVWDCLLVASRHTNNQPTTHMKLPEPPIWLGMILSAIAGAAFIGAVILLKEFVHSY